MRFIKRLLTPLAIAVWDGVSAGVSLYVALLLSYYAGIPNYYRTYLWLFSLALAAVVIFFNLICGCYTRVWSSMGLRDIALQFLAIGLTAATGLLVNWGANLRFNTSFLTRNTYIIWILLMLILSFVGRAFLRVLTRLRAAVRNNRLPVTPVVVYGAGEAGSYLVSSGASNAVTRIRVMAFIDDNPALQGRKVGGVKVAGGFDALAATIEQTGARQVIVAIPTASRRLLQNTLEVCKQKNCMLRRFGTIDDADPSDMKVSDINLEDLLHRGSVQLNMAMVQDFVQGKTVLVSGGAGSIGSELCRQVLRFGCERLVVFDFNENGLFHIGNELREQYDGRFELRLGSIRDRERLNEVFTEFSPQIVFHAAAHKHVPMMELNPREAVKNNVMGTVNMCQIAITHGVQKFITISTDKAVNPTNIMGATKRITELIMQLMEPQSDTEFAAVRFGNVLGSNGSVVPFFKQQIEKGGPVTVTHPQMRRYFMTIPEACQLVLEAGAMAGGGEIFVLDMGEPVLISDLARDMIRLSGLEPDVDIQIVYTGLRPGEKLFEEISLAEEDVDHTANKKIMIMKPVEFDQQWLAQTVKQLEQAVADEDDPAMFRRVKELVPTFQHESLQH